MTKHDVLSKMYRFVCEECDYESDKKAKTVCNTLADIHNDVIHDGEEVAGVEEVEVGDG